MAATPEIRASDLAYVSRWGRVASLMHQLLRRPDPVKMLEERQKRGRELRKGLDWPEKNASPEVVVIRLRDYAKYPKADIRLLDFSASPWFKFEVKNIADDCLEVFDSLQDVRISKGKARPVSRGENGRTVYVVGRIPLESIALINWSGDPAYALPRLYCHYGGRGPYREVLLYQEHDNNYFEELHDITFKGPRFVFPRRFWRNWRARRFEKEARKEQWAQWES